ncbi:MAG TPA: HD domain-containing protein [Alphaproteobacteria bacterium]|nr:HD domain-containing protein [Alphaproteobacteria bacterium]
MRRVWANARLIATQEKGANLLLVELAALLHDVDDPKVTGGSASTPLENASTFLRKVGADQHLIHSVCRIIDVIGYRKSVRKNALKTLEDQIVSDADRLDAMGAIGIARCFVFTGATGRPMFKTDLPPRDVLDESAYADRARPDNTAINHFFDKLLRLKERMATKTGHRMARERHETMVSFLRTFFREQDLPEWEKRLERFLMKTESNGSA